MKRRDAIKNIGLAGVTTTSMVATQKRTLSQTGNTNTEPLIEWRMATSWPESLEIVYGSSQRVCRRGSELTNERFKITPFPAGGIAPPLEILDVVQTGKVECGHTAGYYYVDKNPALGFATAVPFGLDTYQHITWMQKGGGLELLRQVYADFNCVNFICCSTGNQMGGWFKKQVNTVADFKGLKMRMPGLGGKVMTSLGAETQNLPPDQIVAALEQNTIDAAEWVGPAEDEKLGLNKVASYYYYPGWHEPCTTYEIIVNKKSWDSLPLSYQQALEVATMEAHLLSIAEYDQANQEAITRLVEGGTKLVPFSQEILKSAQTKAFELYEQQASENPSFKEVYTQWKLFREQIFQWNKINELSLDDFLISTLTS